MRYKQTLIFLGLFTTCVALSGCGHHKRHRRHHFSAADVTTLTIGLPHTGYIDGAGDTDLYSVVLTTGMTYRISTLNLSSDMDTVLRLFDAEGVLLAEHDDVSETDLSSLIEILISQDGVYTIAVSHKDAAAFSGMYDLLVEVVDNTDGDTGDEGDEGGDAAKECPEDHGSDPDHDCRID